MCAAQSFVRCNVRAIATFGPAFSSNTIGVSAKVRSTTYAASQIANGTSRTRMAGVFRERDASPSTAATTKITSISNKPRKSEATMTSRIRRKPMPNARPRSIAPSDVALRDGDVSTASQTMNESITTTPTPRNAPGCDDHQLRIAHRVALDDAIDDARCHRQRAHRHELRIIPA